MFGSGFRVCPGPMVAFPRNPREFRVCDKFYFDQFGLRHGQLRLSLKSRYASREKCAAQQQKEGKSRTLGYRAET